MKENLRLDEYSSLLWNCNENHLYIILHKYIANKSRTEYFSLWFLERNERIRVNLNNKDVVLIQKKQSLYGNRNQIDRHIDRKERDSSRLKTRHKACIAVDSSGSYACIFLPDIPTYRRSPLLTCTVHLNRKCEQISSLILGEEHGLRVSENRVLRWISGPKREGVAGD
jgi:hypothetical protein